MAHSAAQSVLYAAQDASGSARDKLAATAAELCNWQPLHEHVESMANQLAQSQSGVSMAASLIAAAVPDAAAVAADVQASSEAITLLASDLGTILSIATASLSETAVYTHSAQANSLMNEVANQAHTLSNQAMHAAASTAEIVAAACLVMTVSAKSTIDTILDATQAALNELNIAYASDQQAVHDATAPERQAQANLKQADGSLSAIELTYRNARRQLDRGVHVELISERKITIEFSSWLSPGSAFTTTAISKIVIPDADPHDYLILLPQEESVNFTLTQATQLLLQSSDAGSTESGLLKLISSEHAGIRKATVLLTVDALARPIIPGQPYVALVLTSLALAYQQYLNQFLPLLSAPSRPFIPACPSLSVEIANQVKQATFQVAQNQAILSVLNAKLQQAQELLNEADQQQSKHLKLRDSVKGAITPLQQVATTLALVTQQTKQANTEISKLAADLSDLVKKLIFSIAFTDKLAQTVNQQKQMNPLLPDILLARFAKASTDAAPAIALTLIALQTTYAAQVNLQQAHSFSELENGHVTQLVSRAQNSRGIVALSQQAYAHASHQYQLALNDVTIVTTQLTAAQTAFDSSMVELSSYSAALLAIEAISQTG
ncbi:hypothetical protein [Undibacterium sp. CCC1.1]|nr:hypothetical protein [Undibacterium sp. CCC1.1]MEB0172986.1 hypothetical protein [Undibacterium sp. CCC1.1]